MKGNHERYYQKERWEKRIKKIGMAYLADKKRDFAFHLAGFLKCKCGKMMTGDMKKVKRTGGTKGAIIYYRHACPNSPKQIYLREERVFEIIDKKIKNVRFSDQFARNLKKLFQGHLDHK